MGQLFAGAVASKGINGVGLARPEGAVGVRFLPLFPRQGLFDDKLVFTTLQELGPHDPEDRYHRISFDVPVAQEAINRFLGFEHHDENGTYVFRFENGEAARVTLEWALKDGVVFGKVSTTQPLSVLAIGHGCLSPGTVITLDDRSATIQADDFTGAIAFAGSAETSVQAETIGGVEAVARGYLPSDSAAAGAGRMSGHQFSIQPDHPLVFALGENTAPIPVPSEVSRLLEDGYKAMQPRLMRGSGEAGEVIAALQDIVGFMKSYYPDRDLRAVPVNRAWGSQTKPAPVFCWDNFFDSYLAAFFDPELAKESLRHIVDVLDEDLAAAPPQRNLIIPLLYSRTVRMIGDKDYAAQTFDGMLKFIRFWFEPNPEGHPWRDGNDDGLIECGAFPHLGKLTPARLMQEAFDETGYDDSPMYCDGFAYHREGIAAKGVEFLYDRGTLNLTMVGQNALYVASCRSLALVADWIDKNEEATWLRGEADRVAARMQERLYSSEKGYYLNRFFDGSFSPVKTMTIFYPLLAGLGDEATQARLKETLLDPEQFWGEYVIPTVSRDDPAFCTQPHWGAKDWPGNYWRGFIWGPTNYITHLAIDEAGWNGVAGEFAEKSRTQWLEDWREHRIFSENYPPHGRTDPTRAWFKNGGRCAHYAWSLCMILPALETLFSVEAVEAGIRFGTIQPALFGTWENAIYEGKPVSSSCTDDGLSFTIGQELSVTSPVPLEVRAFRTTSDGTDAGSSGSFRYTSNAQAEVKITIGQVTRILSLSKGENQPVTF